MGTVGILNVAAGDTKLTFDPKDPEESKRSATIVEDMIRRGFVLLIEVGRDDKGPTYRRAHAFDPETHEYIIAGPPQETLVNVETTPAAPRRSTRRGKAQSTRVPASKTTAVAVARTAGG